MEDILIQIRKDYLKRNCVTTKIHGSVNPTLWLSARAQGGMWGRHPVITAYTCSL